MSLPADCESDVLVISLAMIQVIKNARLRGIGERTCLKALALTLAGRFGPEPGAELVRAQGAVLAALAQTAEGRVSDPPDIVGRAQGPVPLVRREA